MPRKMAYVLQAVPGGAVQASATDVVDVYKHDGDASAEANLDTDAEGLWSFTWAVTGSAGTSWVLDPGPIRWEATIGGRTRRGSSKSGGAVGPNSLLELPILFAAWTGGASDGAVIDGQLNEFTVTYDGAGLDVDINTGYAILDGQLVTNPASRELTVSAADATNPRIDRVILERTRTAGDTEGKVVLKMKNGTPAASPAPPALTNDANTLQISLAQVRVNAGSTTVTSVTDERTFALTGVAKNPVICTTARTAPGATAVTSTSGATIAALQQTPTLVSGVWYTVIVEAELTVDGVATVISIAPFIDGTGNAAPYQVAPAQSGIVTLSNTHQRRILGAGAAITCGVLAKRSNTSNTPNYYSGTTLLAAIPES